MLRLKKRPGSPHWQIVGTCPYTRDRVRKSTGVDREDEAKGVLAAYLARAHDEAVHGPQSQVLLAEAVIEYVGKKGEARFLGPILDHLGKKRMAAITDQDLTALAEKVYPNASAATLVRQLYGPMQAIWNAAERARMTPPRTFAKPTVRRKPVDAPDDQWLMKALAACQKHNHRAVLMFMSFGGARAQETVDILVRHHDPVAGTVLLASTKNNDGRLVPLPHFVNAAICELDHSNPEARLFGFAQRFGLNNMLKRVCGRAGIPYRSPHKAGRHAFAARLLKDGNSIKALMEAGGWRSLAAVSVYAHLERAQVDRAVREVSTLIGTNKPQLIEHVPDND